MDFTAIFLIATVLVAIITAVTEVVKRAVTIPVRYLPLVSMVIGVIVGLATMPLNDYSIYVLIWSGAIAGLAASGLFDLSKLGRKENK